MSRIPFILAQILAQEAGIALFHIEKALPDSTDKHSGRRVAIQQPGGRPSDIRLGAYTIRCLSFTFG